jgi:hypothetical protein
MKEIKVGKKEHFALVDDEDYEHLSKFKWCLRSGYATTSGKYPTWMHKEVMKSQEMFDHKNRNKLDNRKENLRAATKSQNTANTGVARDSKTGLKGVWFRKDRNRYAFSIVKDGVVHSKKNFKNSIDAALAYDEKARELFGEFACVNFPGQKPDKEPIFE